MSTIAEYVYMTLSGASAVHALVDDRIYPSTAPEATPFPYVVFQKISSTPNTTHEGGSASRLDETIIQFTIVAKDYTKTEDIARAIRDTLDDSPPPENGSTDISNIRETYEDDTELFVTQLDAQFFHST